METKLSIVIPAYNEAFRIGRTLGRISDYMKERDSLYEVIVVDDGSNDHTIRVVGEFMEKNPAISLLQNGVNRGKGYSVRRGVLYSRGRFILMSDADLSTPIEEIEKLYKELDEGYDISIGSRALSDSVILKRQPWYRQLMGKTFNKFVQGIAIKGIRDTQCGFKLFKGDAARVVFSRQRIDRFAFDVEALYLAKRMGFSISEVPVVWKNSPDSKVSIFRDSLQMLKDIAKIRYYHYRPERVRNPLFRPKAV